MDKLLFILIFSSAISFVLADLAPSAEQSNEKDVGNVVFTQILNKVNSSCHETYRTVLYVAGCAVGVFGAEVVIDKIKIENLAESFESLGPKIFGTFNFTNPSAICSVVATVDELCLPAIRNLKVKPTCEPIMTEIRSGMNLIVNECKEFVEDKGKNYEDARDCYAKNVTETFERCYNDPSNSPINPSYSNPLHPETVCRELIKTEKCSNEGVRPCTDGMKKKLRDFIPFLNRFVQTFGFILPSCGVEKANSDDDMAINKYEAPTTKCKDTAENRKHTEENRKHTESNRRLTAEEYEKATNGVLSIVGDWPPFVFAVFTLVMKF